MWLGCAGHAAQYPVWWVQPRWSRNPVQPVLPRVAQETDALHHPHCEPAGTQSEHDADDTHRASGDVQRADWQGELARGRKRFHTEVGSKPGRTHARASHGYVACHGHHRSTRPSRRRPAHPADLDASEVEALGRSLDTLRQQVLDERGAADAAYIRRVITVQRCLELAGRLVLLASRRRPAWYAGTAALALAKVLDNMEIGHNVLHGQWDWMRDPRIHSSTWDWDHASPPEQWQRAHNDRHHVNTNVLGKDNDLGYGIMRVDEAQPWQPRHLVQPLLNMVNACIFEWGVAMYDLDLGAALRDGKGLPPRVRSELRTTVRRAGRLAFRDYVLHPVASLPTGSSRSTLTANIVANLLRNV